MQLTIDRGERAALYDACASALEACGAHALSPTDPRARDTLQQLWQRLRLVGPLLDQIGWDPGPQRDHFDIALDPPRMWPFLRHELAELEGSLRDSTVADVDEDIAYRRERNPGEEIDRDAELAAMRAEVDATLDQLSACRRLLGALERAEPVHGDDL